MILDLATHIDRKEIEEKIGFPLTNEDSHVIYFHGVLGVFFPIDQEKWEIHCYAEPSIRGSEAYEKMLYNLNKFIDLHPEIKELWGTIPIDNKPAKINAFRLGFRKKGRYTIQVSQVNHDVDLYVKKLY